jgi:hypothetical protein
MEPSVSIASMRTLDQILFRTCALQCTDENGTSALKKDCIKGCKLAFGKPLEATALALNILGLEDDDAIENGIGENKRVAENRLISLAGGVERGCIKECITSCSGSEQCISACSKGCVYFAESLIRSKKNARS